MTFIYSLLATTDQQGESIMNILELPEEVVAVIGSFLVQNEDIFS